jgi:hypothetical protein
VEVVVVVGSDDGEGLVERQTVESMPTPMKRRILSWWGGFVMQIIWMGWDGGVEVGGLVSFSSFSSSLLSGVEQEGERDGNCAASREEGKAIVAILALVYIYAGLLMPS